MAAPPSFSRASPSALAQQQFAQAAQLHQAGRLDQAQTLYEAVLKALPRHAETLHLLGNLRFQKGDPKRALQLIGKAVDLNPGNPAYRYNRALILQQTGRTEEAAAAFGSVTALDPHDADAWAGRGEMLLLLGRAQPALESLDRASALRPATADLHMNRGVALRALGRLDEALAAQDRALAAGPSGAEAWSNRGNVLQDLGRLEDALASHDRALALKPGHVDAWLNRGNALRGLGRLEDALVSLDRALALDPGSADGHYHRGLVLTDLRRLDEAETALDRAIALRPDHAWAALSKATIPLLRGDFARGWPLYEARRRLNPDAGPRALRRPPWLGETPLQGRTILVHAEQGLGDTLQFCRYAAPLAERGTRVILQVQEPLLGLLEGLQGVAVLLAQGQTSPAFDLHCPLLSLPLALGTTLETIPAQRAYLAARPDKVQTWAAALGPRTRPRIGLAWSGRAEHNNDRSRSLPLAELIPQLPGRFDYVSLHQEVRPSDQAALAANPRIRFFGPQLADFTDTAALVSLMDVVVSVDTSIAHLAGALGMDTRLLLARIGQDWRWLLDRTDSPWYPTMTLYRQDADCGWAGSLAAVWRDLAIQPQ